MTPDCDALAPAQPDWLRHELTVSGPAAEILRFREAARGAGAIPWGLPDLALEEEDRMHALLNPPDGSKGMTPGAARVLARLLCSAVEAHADRVVRAAGPSLACPFDLHALLPIPAPLLAQGPDAPGSREWLRTHWGVVQSLRRVSLRIGTEDRRRTRTGRLAYEFWSADWTPWAAILALRTAWPALTFAYRPDYGHDG